MLKAAKPNIYNIAAHGGFADALAQGLIDRFAKDSFGLAKGLVILPNNRARRAVQEAFVRLSENGLLLPQLAVIGDLELDESIGVALDSGDLALDIPAAVNPFDRLLMLSRMIASESAKNGDPVLAKDALRLAREFARTLDQLTVEELRPEDLLGMAVEPELSVHWQKSLAFFRVIAEKWAKHLDSLGMVDEATRRNALFNQIRKNWTEQPPENLVVAAGITTSAPAIAKLQEAITFLPKGMVVLPDLDLITPDEEWNLLGPFKPDPDSGYTKRAQETHPQYHMKLLLDRMSIARPELKRWPRTGESGAAAKRSKALSNAFAIPKLTARWQSLATNERSLAGVQILETRNSAEEAQSVALLAREALEKPEQRIAIITPDRALAGRISALLQRWDIQADDTAGQKLSKTPEGIFLLSLLSTIADGFPPSEFLGLLKHPLVQAGDGRLEWLENVRNLDLLLRGPRPAPGLAGIDALLAGPNERTEKLRLKILPWWSEVKKIFEPAGTFSNGELNWPKTLQTIRNLAEILTAGAIWAKSSGRELANFFTELEARYDLGPKAIKLEELEGYFDTHLSNISVRPAYGGHPRIALYGLLEARLQQADLVICCGLNEGRWPQAITPDPWLAPMVRKNLGLPAQERQIGLSAHDLVGAMGAKNVILTRAQRDDSGPTIASRFLLRLQAMCGDNLKEHPAAAGWSRLLDKPKRVEPASQPHTLPTPEQRNVSISVTQVDRLIADPFAFYASRIMDFGALDSVDAEPSAAWRGTIIHDILEKWAKEDDYNPDKLKARAEAFLSDRDSHPLMRTLWTPRLMEGLRWVAETVAKDRRDGREPAAAEIRGRIEIAGVTLKGVADRIDKMPDGSLSIVDYKTGGPPSNKAVKEGFNLQLGLLGTIAEHEGFSDISGEAKVFEYWSLAKKNENFGYVQTPTKGRSDNIVATDEMVDHAVARFNDAADKYITGTEPMTAKLHPEYAPYADYDQLMRLEEWYGRTDLEKERDGRE